VKFIDDLGVGREVEEERIDVADRVRVSDGRKENEVAAESVRVRVRVGEAERERVREGRGVFAGAVVEGDVGLGGVREGARDMEGGREREEVEVGRGVLKVVREGARDIAGGREGDEIDVGRGVRDGEEMVRNEEEVVVGSGGGYVREGPGAPQRRESSALVEGKTDSDWSLEVTGVVQSSFNRPLVPLEAASRTCQKKP